jgi:protein-tyrosine phosphatase
LVFVCKGNICRSAYAHAKVGSAGFPAASFGIAAPSGVAADEKAITHAAARKVSLAAHRTTPLREYAPRRRDLVVCMEPAQAKLIANIYAGEAVQVTLLGLWSRPRRPWLFDPYGAYDGYWGACLDAIDSGTDHILTLVKATAAESLR